MGLMGDELVNIDATKGKKIEINKMQPVEFYLQPLQTFIPNEPGFCLV